MQQECVPAEWYFCLLSEKRNGDEDEAPKAQDSSYVSYRTVSHSSFSPILTGVVLYIAPAPSFPRQSASSLLLYKAKSK